MEAERGQGACCSSAKQRSKEATTEDIYGIPQLDVRRGPQRGVEEEGAGQGSKTGKEPVLRAFASARRLIIGKAGLILSRPGLHHDGSTRLSGRGPSSSWNLQPPIHRSRQKEEGQVAIARCQSLRSAPSPLPMEGGTAPPSNATQEVSQEIQSRLSALQVPEDQGARSVVSASGRSI
jgi:hypothetical protein